MQWPRQPQINATPLWKTVEKWKKQPAEKPVTLGRRGAGKSPGGSRRGLHQEDLGTDARLSLTFHMSKPWELSNAESMGLSIAAVRPYQFHAPAIGCGNQ